MKNPARYIILPPDDGGLNVYEVELLKAAQGADDRARNDALNLLRSNRNTKN